MRLLENECYRKDLMMVADLDLPWEKLQHSCILISGATGMIGFTLIQVLMDRNERYGLDCQIIALGRNAQKARERFSDYQGCSNFIFAQCDINDMESLKSAVGAVNTASSDADAASFEKQEKEARPHPKADGSQKKTDSGTVNERRPIDYIFHAASNTHPVAYATDPVGTVVTNIIGLNNLLELACSCGCKRFLFASSNEIYGENRGDIDLFDEKYCGYIDCNTLRAGYPESKRAGEALCQAYIRQKGLDVVIPRFTRSFGPTLLKTDTKALSQFIGKGVAGEDIVLKSAGTQYFSYTYVMDAVSGLLTCLMRGSSGEAYNISDRGCDIRLRDLAGLIAEYVGRKVIFEIPDEVENAGYSKATKALLDSSKLQGLGWKAQFDIETALHHTIDIMKAIASE